MLQSAYISIISGASLWGLIALFFKFLTACGFSPLQIVALRVLFAAVLMTAVIFKIDPKLLKIRWRDSWLFIGTGIFSLVFFNYCYFRSIESSSISIAVLLLYTAPVFVMLLSIFLFREKFTRCKMLALLSTFCGCTFITGIFSSKMTLTLEAFGFGLASGIGYALYSIFSKLALRRYNTLTITAYTFYFAAIAALPMAERTITAFHLACRFTCSYRCHCHSLDLYCGPISALHSRSSGCRCRSGIYSCYFRTTGRSRYWHFYFWRISDNC